MKADQIAYYCATPEAELKVKRMLGLVDAPWVRDTVTARSTVWGRPAAINVGLLQFNYSLGIELEILRYTTGDFWHNPFFGPEPFLSHIGIHLDQDEPMPEHADKRLAQETWTIAHTAEYLTTGAGAGRKYHYRIYELSPGNYIKYIKRIDPR